MSRPVPKSLLGKRMLAQFEFDWGVKGWAFMHPCGLRETFDRAQRLYTAIGFHDEHRSAVVVAIREALEANQ